MNNTGTSTADFFLYFLDDEEVEIGDVYLENYVPGGFQTNTWHEIEIPLSDLNFEDYTGATQFIIEASAAGTIYLDDIEFVGEGGSTSYANPHAATLINGVSYQYDNNGNLASTSAGAVNTWNYDNRLTQSSGTGIATTTYAYDAAGQRITKTSNGITTRYPSNLYETKGTTTTKHIYAGDSLIATIDSTGTYHNHLDHLGSTNAVTNDAAYLNQELQYYPFGSTRISNQYGDLNQSNQYIGQNLDEETDLSYLNARYYDSGRGQLLSQDPVFINIGLDSRTPVLLRDPQLQNSYGYARNNPLIYKDPSGDVPLIIPVIYIGLQVWGAYDLYQDGTKAVAVFTNPNDYTFTEKVNAYTDVGLDILFGKAGRFVDDFSDKVAYEATAAVTDILKGYYDEIQGNMTPRVKSKHGVQSIIDQNTRNSPLQQSQVQKQNSSKSGSSTSKNKSSSSSGSKPTKKEMAEFQKQIDKAAKEVDKLKKQIESRTKK